MAFVAAVVAVGGLWPDGHCGCWCCRRYCPCGGRRLCRFRCRGRGTCRWRHCRHCCGHRHWRFRCCCGPVCCCRCYWFCRGHRRCGCRCRRRDCSRCRSHGEQFLGRSPPRPVSLLLLQLLPRAPQLLLPPPRPSSRPPPWNLAWPPAWRPSLLQSRCVGSSASAVVDIVVARPPPRSLSWLLLLPLAWLPPLSLLLPLPPPLFLSLLQPLSLPPARSATSRCRRRDFCRCRRPGRRDGRRLYRCCCRRRLARPSRQFASPLVARGC